jgi:predicted nucleic acid-binding protein
MLDEPVLIDTGAFAALFDPRDQYHATCKEQFALLPIGKAYTCWPVITEAAYLARRYPRQRDELLHCMAAGEFPLLQLVEADLVGIQHILSKYRDQEIDLADAALVHLANRERIDVIFTLDRRHFALLRSTSGRAFRLVPEIP